jgi:multidrug efflux pump subunit AcrA (membrane-fusion protein)
MKKNVLLIVLLSTIILTGCGKKTETETKTAEKQPYYISVTKGSELKSEYTLKKTGKLSSNSEIIVSALIWWRVASINKWIGDIAQKNETVIQLQETSGVYSFWAQRAATSITQAQLTYEQTLQNIEKAMQDTQFGIKQAENQVNNTQLNNETSAATVQLQSARENLEKTKIDYETKLLSDEQTLQNFSQNARNITKDAQLLYESITTEADKLLGVSDLRKAYNDAFENVLWAKNTSTKFSAEDALRKAILDKQNLEYISISNDPTEITTTLQSIKEYVLLLNALLESIDTMLVNTISSNSYSETQLATQRASIDLLQTQTQGQISAITAQINSMNSFLSTYKESQSSLAKVIDLAEQSYKAAEANLQTAENNARIQLDSLQNTLNTTLKNKDTTVRSLENTIKQAQIAYNEAWFQLSKLRAASPIAWTVIDILVDVGQDVAPWTPLYKINSLGKQEIEITLTQDEANTLEKDMPVIITYNDIQITWYLTQISQSPSVGVSYKAIITTDTNTIPGWSLVDIFIQQPTAYTVIPLNRIQLLSTTKWQITVRDWSELRTEKVDLWKIKWNQIEITSSFTPSDMIVTSEVKQFDKEKHFIELKK